jgi:DNA-binding transcriptional MocR family regulator
MTIWRPRINRQAGPIYLAIVEALASDVAAGRLRPGERLPPQRELAGVLHVTVPTVTRAYGLAAKRGLVTGAVGRGTFVAPPIGATADAVVDLSLNALPPHAHFGELSARLDLPGGLAERAQWLAYPPRPGHEAHREAGAAWIARRGLHVSATQVLVTVGAQHALLAALASVLTAGDVVLVEELTYAGVFEAARVLGVRVRAVAIDRDGMRPDALEAAVAESGARVVALQPVLHNPTGISCSPARRAALAAVIARTGLHVIEDDTYGFLAPECRPLAAGLETPWSYITSLSKSVAGGLRVGYLVVSETVFDRASRAIWASTLAASPVTAAIASGVVQDGLADRIVAWKREEVRARQVLAREVLAVPADVDPASPHIWWPLPRPWRAAEFVARAAERGVRLGATDGFVGQPGAVPRAVRICLGPPRTREALRQALVTLRDLGASPPQTVPLV